MFTAVCVVLAAAGHALASCAAVPLWSLGAGFLAVFAVAAPLAGRERSLPGIAVLLAVGQTALHTLFGLGQHGTAAATASDGRGRLARGPGRPAGVRRVRRDAQPRPGPADPRRRPAGHGGTGRARAARARLTRPTNRRAPWRRPPPEPRCRRCRRCPMLLGHVLAAAATGWLLRRGDVALRRPPAALGARSGRGGARRPCAGPSRSYAPCWRVSRARRPRRRASRARHGVRATGRRDDRSPAHGRPARPAGRRGPRPRRLTRRTTPSGRITPGVPSRGTRACPLFRRRACARSPVHRTTC